MDRGASNLGLRPISGTDSGERVRPVSLPVEGRFLVGRSAEADWSVPDASVSRRHAMITRSGDTWLLTDFTSRHGTSVNDRKLEPGLPTPIEDGDVIASGLWRRRCTAGADRRSATTPFAPLPAKTASVSAIPAQQLSLNDGSCVRLRPERKDHVWAYL